MMYRLLTCTILLSVSLLSCKSGDGPTGGESELFDVSVAVTPSGAGAISPSADSTYQAGETLSLLATPGEEYLFTGWEGDAEGADNPLSLTVGKDYALTATFKLKNYELTTTTEGEGTLDEAVVQEKSKEYEHGTVVELTATPAEGWAFVEWTGDVEGTDNPAQLTVDDPKEVTAVFEKKDYELTVTTEGEGAVDEKVVTAKSYEHGTIVELTPTPATGWEFAEWKGDLSGTDNPSQITIDEAKEVIAVFEKKTYALEVTAGEGGSIAKDPDQTEYVHGEQVELTATPDEGYRFVEWQGDLSGSDNPAQITVDEAKEVTAVFEQLDYYRAANGVTIMCPGVATGNSFTLDGDTYTKLAATDITEANASTTCTSGITDMSQLFMNATTFNENISHWDTRAVTTMEGIFASADAFNADISGWDVSAVTDMTGMFAGADAFNADISGWDVSAVTDMDSMFNDADAFNADISGWDVSAVTNMAGMFSGADAFNADISGWDVSAVTDMDVMFYNAAGFSQALNWWCVSQITTKPTDFDTNAGFWLDDGRQPQWGNCPGS